MRRLIALILITLFVSGRWDYRDIKDKTIVAGMSVDMTEGGQKLVTFEMANISPNHDQPIEPFALSTVGETTQEAINNVAGDLADSVYTGHAWLLLLSEEVARDGIDKLITLINSHPKYYMLTDVAVVRDVPAKEVFDCEAVGSTFISYELNNGFRTDERYVGKTYQMYAYQIYSFLKDPYRGYLIPAVSIIHKNEKKFAENDGSAIFLQDRLVGFLSPDETQMYRIAMCKIKRTELRVLVEGEPVSLAVENCQTKLGVRWRGNTPVFSLEVDLKLSTSLLQKIDKHELLEESARQTVERGIRLLLSDAQALRCDYLGFADLLHRHHLSRWNMIKHDWPEIFSKVVCTIQVRTEVLY
ncbi:MAG: Ger(x)C family spore germination protein [Clostridia bacterium]|nr:Ger(x)C family spore germination protein [Clostridia bacterium]